MADPRDPLNEQATPTLEQVLREAIENHMTEVHTSMPGRVVKYYPADCTADVQPCFKRQYVGEDSPVTLPVIPRVPVAFYRTASGWFRFPLEKDDYVELIFQERSIARWFLKGGIEDPKDSRLHDFADAIAFPGAFPKPGAISPKGSPDSLEIAWGNTFIEITKAGKIRITNGEVDLLDVLSSLISTMSDAKAVDPATGMNPMDPGTKAALAQLSSKISQLKA